MMSSNPRLSHWSAFLSLKGNRKLPDWYVNRFLSSPSCVSMHLIRSIAAFILPLPLPLAPIRHTFLAAALLFAGASARVTAQSTDGAPRRNAYGVGESLIYDVKFGFLNVGTARMDVLGIETIRGRRAWHTKLEITGGIPGYRVHEVLESWIDMENENSLRHVKQSVEGSRERSYTYEILPERGVFRENDKPEQPTVEHPLDDGAFLYFVRNQPLVVGKSYDFPRYFIPDRNPVTVQVERTERIEVPAGPFDTIVLRPIIKARGVFSKNGRAELWLTNDERRLMVRMETHLAFGTISLRLREFTQGMAPR